tara:strand:+ start:273 stop:632 length:360 start_codon:yes stop_codon:yes gene_type:complete
MINDFYKKTPNKFKQGYKNFKNFHNNYLNIIFHFFTSVLQIYWSYLFVMEFNFLYLLFVILIPYLTDGIGHLIEKNFTIVLMMSKLEKSTNSAGVNGFYNFLYKILLFIETFFFKKINK